MASGCRYLILPHGVALFGIREQLPEDDAASDLGAGYAAGGLRPGGHSDLRRGPGACDLLDHRVGALRGQRRGVPLHRRGRCSWYDFAAEIAAAAGHDTCRIIPCHTSEYPTEGHPPGLLGAGQDQIQRDLPDGHPPLEGGFDLLHETTHEENNP